MAQHINIHEITGSITDINENLNTLFADSYINENDIKSIKKHVEKLISNDEKMCQLFKMHTKVISCLQNEIYTLKNKENGFYSKFVTTFSYGFGIFSSFAIITLIMRKID